MVNLCPTLILLSANKSTQSVQWSDLVGFPLWTLGFALQSLADYQKFTFRSDPANQVPILFCQ